MPITHPPQLIDQFFYSPNGGCITQVPLYIALEKSTNLAEILLLV